MELKDFEIMAPAGSYESLTAAIQGGADSVYFGIEGLNMRAKSSNNFTIDDLHNIARICHENGMKSYLTVNTIIYPFLFIASHSNSFFINFSFCSFPFNKPIG